MREKESGIVIVTIIVLMLSILLPAPIGLSGSPDCQIDIYTGKEPYSGAGHNIPSDAFGPEEIAILYALVTYNYAPVGNILVGFKIAIPSGRYFTLTARTNLAGFATVNFTISTPPIEVNESEVFGTWSVLADAYIDARTIEDTLTFKVDWIVRLLSVRTIDENGTYRHGFGREGDVGFEITVRNLAMTLKNATISFVIQDELNVPVNFSEIHNIEIQANEKPVYLYYRLFIPKWAYIGVATIHGSAFTAPVSQGGVPYCPAVSTTFYILPTGALSIAFHDVAIVDVSPSVNPIEIGQNLRVDIIARNEGTEIEDLNVSAYFGDVYLGASLFAAVQPYGRAVPDFYVNTSDFGAGNHTISASVLAVSSEIDLTDNMLTNEVEILPPPPPIIHDVTVTNVSLSSNVVYVSDRVFVNVTVVNVGTVTESFSVSTYYSSVIIDTLFVTDLEPNATTTLVSIWNTSSVREGVYQISAFAALDTDSNPADNLFLDGVVQVKTPPIFPIKYYLTVRTDPANIAFISGEGRYDEGTNAHLTAPSYVFQVSDVRYRFMYWDVDGSTSSGNPIDVLMNSDHVATAHFVVQYYLTVASPYGATSGEGWYDMNSEAHATLSTGQIDLINWTRHIFTRWEGDASGADYSSSDLILMNRPKTALANWRTQYQVSFAYINLDSSATGTVLTVDGAAKTYGQLPYFSWVDNGTAINYSYSAVVESTVQGKRFTLTEIEGPPSPFVVVTPTLVIGNFEAQYYLTVRTDPDGIVEIPGEGWYDLNTNVTLTALTVERYDFKYWDTDGISAGAGISAITVRMDNPHMSTAHYNLRIGTWFTFEWFYLLLLLLLILLLIFLILCLYYRRRKKEKTQSSFRTGWSAWYYGYHPFHGHPKTLVLPRSTDCARE